MTRTEIGKIISQAIRKEKYIYINYINKQKEETKYWIAIYDILLDDVEPRLKCEMYNPSKNIEGTLTTNLFLNGIQSATIIEFSHYDVPDSLLHKLEKYTGECDWLEYDTDVRYLLNYYEQCNYYDKDPYQKISGMIRGIDLHVLQEKREVSLSKEQKKEVVTICQKQLYKSDNLKFCELAFSKLSIDIREKKYVVCYYNLNFNPKEGTLCLDKILRFNKTFLHKRIFEEKLSGESWKSSLFQYTEMDLDKFIELYLSNEKQAEEIIRQNLRQGIEMINTRPDIMLLERDIAIDLKSTYDIIVERDKNNILNTPIKAFLGKITKRDLRKKEPEIIICDNKINVDQTRVLYNALKQPITYVQGPPGTGKTQTILNVVLNGFYNKRTILVCSSNNKPVDGIIEKLSINYNEKKIPFPFLRLGNIEQEKKAIERIKSLFGFTINKNPDEEKLKKIESTTNSKNERLKDILKHQEDYVQTKSYLEDAKKLATIIGEQKNQFANEVKIIIEKFQNNLIQNPEVKNEELSGLFTSLEDDYWLKQWMYYSSLKCILMLQKQEFCELRSICNIPEEQQRVTNFNKWLSNDDNMKNLVKAFPIIFTTNISARRLGSPNFMFDLVIMDEAGQCNIAHSLIPLAKANSLLLVGDPCQLKPIVVLEDSINTHLKSTNAISDDYDYKHNSILDIMRKHDSISQYVLLKYHYRCGKKIIEFSNQKYYNSALNVSSIKENGVLTFIPCENKNNDKRSSFDEAKGIIEYIKRNSIKDAMIITPFVNQKDLINKFLKEEGITDVECGTIHSMQGGEKQTIILSTALSTSTSQRTFDWIKNNTELINVAVTRAKKNLVVFSDDEAMAKLAKGEKSDLIDLIQYVKSNGNIEVPMNETLKLEIAKSNGSYYENEFYKTISQFCSVHDSFESKRNVSFKDFFADDEILKNNNSEFDCVLYEKKLGRLYPQIVIEINGGEHFGDKSREKADNRKREICKQKGLKFLVISNSFVKSYEQIRNIIINSRKTVHMQYSLFDFENVD